MRAKDLEKNIHFRDEILESLDIAKPVYLIKYRGKTFGYYPAELKDIESCIAINLMLHKGNWGALAALMFRPVKLPSRLAHRFGWKKITYGKAEPVKVKEIDNFAVDYCKYSCSSIDISKTDLSFYEGFPVELIVSNLGFTLGVGLSLGMNIQSSSSKAIQQTKSEMMKEFQESLRCSRLLQTLQRPTSLASTAEKEFLTLLQEKYSTTLVIESLERLKKSSDLRLEGKVWVLTGSKSNKIVRGITTLHDTIIGGESRVKHVKALANLGGAICNRFVLTVNTLINGSV